MYTMIAAGVNLPPQSIFMPFSLILSSSLYSATGRNEMVSRWLLHSSPYTILRNEEKFRTRHDFYCGWSIIRPTIIDACVDCRNYLINIKSGGNSSSNGFYDEKHIPMIGKNIMTERGRKVGISAYSDLIQRYALKGLLSHLMILIQETNTRRFLQQQLGLLRTIMRVMITIQDERLLTIVAFSMG